MSVDYSSPDDLATAVLERCALCDGQLSLPDEAVLACAREIDDAQDKRAWAIALTALANRLKAVPGAGPATDRMLTLSAYALEDRAVASIVHNYARKV